jgi:hypothetical protein
MNEQRNDINQMVAGLRPLRTDVLSRLPETAGAEDLLQRILATDAAQPSMARIRPKPRPSRVLAVAATVALLGASLWVASSMIIRPKDALAVTFGERKGYISAVFTDPAAAKETIDAAFAKRGFDIHVSLVPASPSLVGTVGAMSEDPLAQQHDIKVLYDTGCWTEGGGQRCPIGLLIPKDFAGHASIEVGQAAQPGKTYELGNQAFFPGEDLHCSGIAGMTVEQAMPVLQDLGVRVMWRSMDQSIDDVRGIDPSAVAHQYVQYDGETVASGLDWVWVSPTPPASAIGLYPEFNPEDC